MDIQHSEKLDVLLEEIAELEGLVELAKKDPEDLELQFARRLFSRCIQNRQLSIIDLVNPKLQRMLS